MKKIFTLLSLAMATITSMAQTTTELQSALAVLVNGNPADPQQKVVTTIEDNGKYTLQLKDFILYTQGSPMPVGTITVEGIESETVDGTIIIKTTQDITIASGSDESQTWMGPFLGIVPITLDGTITNGVLKATLDIPFGELQINVFINSAATQVENSGFEDWHTATYSNKSSDEPNRWHSFMSSGGPLASAVAGNTHTYISDNVRPGSEGKKSVKLQSCSVMGFISANGTLTTGRLNAGSMSADNADNHSFIDMTNTDVDGNGDPFYSKIEGRPDSLVVWLKFHPGSGNKNPQALVSAVLTDGTYYQDPEDANTTYNNIAAKAYSNTIESNGEVWQRISLPFDYETYKANSVSPRALLVTISTCATPGGGSKSSSDPDVLYIDDFSLIYNSTINGISVSGKEIADFNPNTTTYDVEVDEAPAVSDIVCTEASEEQVVNVTIEENVAKVLVMSEDLKSFAVYTVNIKVKEQSGVDTINTASDKNVINTYGINGQLLPAGAKAPVVIRKYSDGTVKKSVR